MRVILSETELHLGAMIGLRRRIVSAISGELNRGVKKQNLWDVDITGALGEIAFSKAVGLYLNVTTTKPGKVDFEIGGVKVEVRTAYEKTSRLIVRNGDLDDAAFVLVTGYMNDFDIVGWCWGYEAKRDEWLDNPGFRAPAWFVPREGLRDFEDFLKIVR